ncbi:uncharacterized protein LOC135825721 [Sycon ciliatum]|uniref:uncharacterized protein LOC135825721 n=1 Tax=Sycon ciliatum TaxID=27933 RepID=UPI0031F64696
MPTGKPRSKSAKPGLMMTTNKELEAALMSEQGLSYTESKRAASAVGNRRKGEGTGYVLPRARQREEEKLKSYYTSQFEAKHVSAEDRQARPTSPTRRNNPHPQEEFMAWKLPVRVLESRQGTVTVPVEQLSETGQSFYQDYLTGNDGDAGNEVSTTIARSEFVGRKDPDSAGPDTTATVEYPGYPGSKCRSNTGKLAPLATKTNPAQKTIVLRPASATAKKRVVGATTHSTGTAQQLESWLDSDASANQKDVVISMLKSGATEELRLKKALQSTLAEEALPGVEEWVKTASEQDRKLVLQVFEGLSEAHTAPLADSRQWQQEDSLPPLPSGSRSLDRSAHPPPHRRPISGMTGNRARLHTRRASDPLPFSEQQPIPMMYRGTGAEKILHYNRTRPLGSRAGSRAQSRARSASVNGRGGGTGVSTLEETLDKLAVDAGVDGTEARFSPLPSMHWHQFSKRQHTPNVVHRGAIFGGPKNVGSHWTICPEWPTA